MKMCTKCKVEKDEGEFWKNKARSDGLCGVCKACQKETVQKYSQTDEFKAWRKENRAKPKNKAKEKEYNHRPENKAKRKAQDQSEDGKAWRKEYNQDPEVKERSRILKSSDAYKNKAKINRQKPEVKEKIKEQRQSDSYKELVLKHNNSEKSKSSRKKYQQSPEGKAQAKIRRDEREKEDPFFKTKRRLRGVIRESFRRQGYSKASTTHRMVGCSYEDFSLFVGSKPMEGYELDHICPCNQSVNEEELVKLQHYTNFQWLLKSDNVKKADKITPKGEELCRKLLGREWIFKD